AFLPNDELWLYDLENGLWLHESLLFQLYSVDLQDERFSWRRVTLRSGSLPSPRDKLSCWVHEGRIIYFGGYGHKPFISGSLFSLQAEDIFWGWNNEVQEFDPERSRWTEPQTFGRAPPPRAAHASASIGSKGYVCGGRIKCYVPRLVFVELGLAPVGRSWHTLTAVSDTSLFLFGGLSVDCRPMSDGWMFNLETKGWTEMEHQNKDKPRLWHTAYQGRDSDVVVFGGSHDYILLVDKVSVVYFIASYAGMFQYQILCLPPKLRNAVQKRTIFFRPSTESQNVE
uniref:Kelch domain containing 1 n=1 Tax=Sinocyclocheilus rhinocerous TaxID=307959 RepID=A0A673NCQ9_9TELE